MSFVSHEPAIGSSPNQAGVTAPAAAPCCIREIFDIRIDSRPHRLLHRHEFDEITLIDHPGAIVLHGEERIPVAAGTVVLHRGDELHGYESDGAPTRFMVIHYDADAAFESGLPALGRDGRRMWHLDRAQQAAYIDLFSKIHVEHVGSRPGSAPAAEAWLRLLLIMVSRLDLSGEGQAQDVVQPIDPEIRRLRQAIDARRQGFARGPLADAVENYDALRHRFQRLYGESPNRMLTRIRIETAKYLLVHSDKSMAEIAHEAGYGRQHELARAFRRAVGCTPTAFRRQSRVA